VTKWVWPRPAQARRALVREHGVHAERGHGAAGVLALAAALLFARGAFAAGLVCAWAMTFLDTVDGKLARVTLTSSRIGDVMDHGLDLVHPPFWWWAWGIGLGAGHEVATAIVVRGYLVGRALEGAFLARFGFETHSWRPIDGLFRTITARRNPNLILLSVSALGGRPDLGLVMVALWTIASLCFHALRLAQAETLRARGAIRRRGRTRESARRRCALALLWLAAPARAQVVPDGDCAGRTGISPPRSRAAIACTRACSSRARAPATSTPQASATGSIPTAPTRASRTGAARRLRVRATGERIRIGSTRLELGERDACSRSTTTSAE
jgi:phosphatidylglycerophosphate synthase